ncbi:MAG: 30S ribosomal protein S16 [Acidobacteriota bacterium]
MLKIRLRRMGSRHKPFYRVVVSDGRRVPTASALEELGYYDPRRSPATFQVNLERADHWLGLGAQPSDTVRRLLRRARNADAGAAATEAAPADEGVAEAAAAETAAEETATEEAAPEEATESTDDTDGEG